MSAFTLFSLALLQAAAIVPDYVPDTGWEDTDWSPTYYEDWLGGQLRAMREPALSGRTGLAGYRERFRLLVLPSFEPSYFYRIDVRQDGIALLRWGRLNGRGGYAPGRLVRQGTRPLLATELGEFRHALVSGALSTLSRQEQVIFIDEQGNEVLRSCFDGTLLVLEHLTAHGRAYVVRRCTIEDSLQRLADAVYRMKPRATMN
jgi:hypothetical protein